MDEIKGQHKVAGQSWIQLSPEQRNELLGIYAEAEREKISLRTVWEAYKTGKLDAAPMQRRTLKEAIAETMEAKRAENLRERYLGDLESYLNKFAAGRMEMFIDKIGVADVERWFADRGEALTTRKSNIGRLGSMFDVCFRRGYIRDNPIVRISSPKIDHGTPERFTADEAKTLLKEARQRPASLGYFVLALFAGIRPEELAALKWSAVDMKSKLVRIEGEQSKVRHHRDVPLHDTCIAWLKTIEDRNPDSPIAPPAVTLRRHRRALREKLGKWPQDVLRHTAASFLVELHTKKELVAKWLGNSERTLDRNYLSQVRRDECKKFWALTPKGIQ
jgi:integrase